MDLLTSWVLAPAILAALATGCGALVERACGARLPTVLLPAVGLAAIVVAGQFTTLLDATAELTAPLVVVAAAGGLVLLTRRTPPPSLPWAPLAAGGVLLVYAAPIVASGEATFAGYIRLDDTATWMTLTDRVMEHGRSLEGLDPSTYQRTLEVNLGEGYPVGVFLPLGVLATVTGVDVAWLVQPYLACLAVVLALALWSLARAAGAGPRAAAAVAFVSAQPALLFGYYLWGGIKELAAAALIAALAAGVAWTAGAGFAWRALLAPALLCAALVGVLSAGGLLWAAPPMLLAAVLAVRALGLRAAVSRSLAVAVAIAALALPDLASGPLEPPTSAPLTDADASGNLIGPVEPAQVAGIWPSGDFRLDPAAMWPAAVAIAVALTAAVWGCAVLWRRRAWGGLAYVGGAFAAALVLWLVGSPWVDGKALATASPAIVFTAMIGGVALLGTRVRVAGAAVAAVVAGGVLWSNALAYRDANLAPRDQLTELETLGEELDGEGPTLLTEYQPYGARHFLRDADPESVSELRYRLIPLRSGEPVPKGGAADTDSLDPGSLFGYRTLVLRRSPAQSRPPEAYELIWRGDHYEAWQRPGGAEPAPRRLALGGAVEPAAVPSCHRVRALARTAGPGGELVAAARPPAVVIDFATATYPGEWAADGDPSHPRPGTPGTLVAEVEVPSDQAYAVWLGGSARGLTTLAIDGDPIASVRHELNNDGGYLSFGDAEIGRGRHRLTVRVAGADMHPGSGGAPAPIGPLVLSAAEAAEVSLVRVPARAAERLCGRAWDWIEVAS